MFRCWWERAQQLLYECWKCRGSLHWGRHGVTCVAEIVLFLKFSAQHWQKKDNSSLFCIKILWSDDLIISSTCTNPLRVKLVLIRSLYMSVKDPGCQKEWDFNIPKVYVCDHETVYLCMLANGFIVRLVLY